MTKFRGKILVKLLNESNLQMWNPVDEVAFSIYNPFRRLVGDSFVLWGSCEEQMSDGDVREAI